MIADRTGWHEDLLQSIITITISGKKNTSRTNIPKGDNV